MHTASVCCSPSRAWSCPSSRRQTTRHASPGRAAGDSRPVFQRLVGRRQADRRRDPALDAYPAPPGEPDPDRQPDIPSAGQRAEGYPALPQVGLEVHPTQTVARFENAAVKAVATFLTPALPEDLELMSTRHICRRGTSPHATASHTRSPSSSAPAAPGGARAGQKVSWGRAASARIQRRAAGVSRPARAAAAGATDADRLGPPLPGDLGAAGGRAGVGGRESPGEGSRAPATSR